MVVGILVQIQMNVNSKNDHFPHNFKGDKSLLNNNQVNENEKQAIPCLIILF